MTVLPHTSPRPVLVYEPCAEGEDDFDASTEFIEGGTVELLKGSVRFETLDAEPFVATGHLGVESTARFGVAEAVGPGLGLNTTRA